MDRVLNRRTTWFLVNIKAREEQTEEHYVRVFVDCMMKTP